MNDHDVSTTEKAQEAEQHCAWQPETANSLKTGKRKGEGAMNDIDAINEKIDLVQWAEMAGSRMHKAGKEWRGNCPIHGGDNTSGFAIYDGERRWKCFTGDCGGGDALAFVMKLKRLGFLEAVQLITGEAPGSMTGEEIAQMQARRAERAAKELEEQIARAQEVLQELRQSQVWLRYHAQLEENQAGIDWWISRGVSPDFQNFWQLGYETDRRIWIGRELHVPTATIPLFDSEWNCRQIKHRLIDAPDEAGRYRYEYSDLAAPIFISDPDNTSPKSLVVVEGEIKAMVTFATLDTPGVQVIGMPGKETSVDRLKEFTNSAEDIFICCDPDTGNMNEGLAREFGSARCRIVDTPIKIDDYILQAGISKTKLKSIFNQSRRIK